MFIKIFTAFVLGAQVLIFGMLPYSNSKFLANKKLINAFDNLIAGLFLGICFMHIIPEANSSIKEWFQYKNRNINNLDYQTYHLNQLQRPYGTLIALITFLIVKAIQVYLNDEKQSEEFLQKDKTQINQHKKLCKKNLTQSVYLTQIALSIHTIFQCMSIGIQKNDKILYSLALAIIFHKWAEALMLGISCGTSGMSKQLAFKITLFHSFLNIASVIIGYYLSSTSNLIKGITYGISGGTFIYISIMEKISKNLVKRSELFKNLCFIVIGIVFSVLLLN